MKLTDWFNQVFKDKTGNIYVQLIRYVFAGGTAFILDTGVMILLKEVFHVYYLYASIIGFIVGLIFTYMLSILWIFDERRLKSRWNEILIFALIGIVGIGLTWFFMRFFTEFLFTHYVVSKVLTTIIVSLWNFAAKKVLLFTKKKNLI